MTGSTDRFAQHARALLMNVEPHLKKYAVAVTGNGGRGVAIAFRLTDDNTVAMEYTIVDQLRKAEMSLVAFCQTTLADLDRIYTELCAVRKHWQQLSEQKRDLLRATTKRINLFVAEEAA